MSDTMADALGEATARIVIIENELKTERAKAKAVADCLRESIFVLADVSDMLRKYDGLDEWSTPVVNIDRLWGIVRKALSEYDKAKGGEG